MQYVFKKNKLDDHKKGNLLSELHQPDSHPLVSCFVHHCSLTGHVVGHWFQQPSALYFGRQVSAVICSPVLGSQSPEHHCSFSESQFIGQNSKVTKKHNLKEIIFYKGSVQHIQLRTAMITIIWPFTPSRIHCS